VLSRALAAQDSLISWYFSTGSIILADYLPFPFTPAASSLLYTVVSDLPTSHTRLMQVFFAPLLNPKTRNISHPPF
jgi:hypothetical protein